MLGRSTRGFSPIEVVEFTQTDELRESRHGDDGSCSKRPGEFIASNEDQCLHRCEVQGGAFHVRFGHLEMRSCRNITLLLQMEGRIVYTRPSHGDGVSHACLTGSLAPAASGFGAVIADFALSTEIAGGAF